MERVARAVVVKKPCLGGYGFPDISVYLGVHYWLGYYKTFSGGGMVACLMHYLAGWSLMKWGWCVREFKACGFDFSLLLCSSGTVL